MDILSFQELESNVTEMTVAYVNSAIFDVVNAKDLGLDERCGTLLLNPDEGIIAVRDFNDKSLQYYGGFEYVKGEGRKVMGDYVFYLAEASSRVAEAIEYYLRKEHQDHEDISPAGYMG